MNQHHASPSALKRSTRANVTAAIALAGTSLALTFVALNAQAQITEDCILEGTVDMRKAEHLGQPVYVRFEDIRPGTEGNCSLDRRSRSRRVQFVSSMDIKPAKEVEHGERVHYRYVERQGEPGVWELIKVGE